jgi:hypothetical protein
MFWPQVGHHQANTEHIKVQQSVHLMGSHFVTIKVKYAKFQVKYKIEIIVAVSYLHTNQGIVLTRKLSCQHNPVLHGFFNTQPT